MSGEFVVAGLYILAGICAFAAMHHITAALQFSTNREHLPFGGMCLCMALFALNHVAGYRADSAAGYIASHRWNLAAIPPFYVLLLWFTSEYTGIRAPRFVRCLQALFLVLLGINFIEPYTLRFGELPRLEQLRLPWGEVLAKPVGRLSVWFPVGVAAVMAALGFALYALVACYLRRRERTTLLLAAAMGVLVVASVEGILVRMSVVDFAHFGPFGYLAMVIAMSVVVNYEAGRRLRAWEARFRDMAAGVSAASGHEFFDRLVLHLARLFGADYAFVGVPAPGDPARMETVAACAFGAPAANISYVLAGTPCENAFGKTTCVYLDGVQRAFPDDRLLVDMNVHAYIGAPLFGSAGQALGLLVVMHSTPFEDVESVRSIIDVFAARAGAEIERIGAEEQLRVASEQLRATIESSPNVAVQWYDEQGRVVYWNGASEALFGWRSDEALGKTLDQLILAPREAQAFLDNCAMVEREGRPLEPTEFTARHRDGSERTCISTIFALPKVNGASRFVCMDVDVTERKQAEAQIRQMLSRDALTGLANRRSMHDLFAQVSDQAAVGDRSGAMLLIDLDHFKTINDALGHQVGDEVLCAVARRLEGVVGEQAFLARLGGDEFVVVLTGQGKSEAALSTEAKVMADAIETCLAEPITLDERVFGVGASVGVTLFEDDDVSSILRRADMALYRAKALGRGGVQFFDPAMQQAADRRLALERGLRGAVANQQLELHFQPQVTADGRVLGAEALLRWRHPGLGLVSPSVFIPIAEETGLIHAIGDWVIEEACRILVAWPGEGAAFTGRLTVNVSPWQLARPDFVSSVIGRLAAAGVGPDRLTVEVTESTFFTDMRESIERLATLRSAGIGVSLDDFGTGYSSLAYLKKLPLDVLKIDKAFVDELAEDPVNPLSDTIIALGRSANLRVIAEGVETAAQRDRLIAGGCEVFQGFLFCGPLPEQAFLSWLRGDELAAVI